MVNTQVQNIEVTDDCFNDMINALTQRAEELKKLSSECKDSTLLNEHIGMLKSITIITNIKKEHNEKNT